MNLVALVAFAGSDVHNLAGTAGAVEGKEGFSLWNDKVKVFAVVVLGVFCITNDSPKDVRLEAVEQVAVVVNLQGLVVREFFTASAEPVHH